MKLTKTFFEDIRGLIHSARTTVARGVDLVQVYTNFEIGRRIVEQEQKGKGRAAYGQEVIRQLADRLTEEFGRGYSKRSLELMRQFYFLTLKEEPQLRRQCLRNCRRHRKRRQHLRNLPKLKFSSQRLGNLRCVLSP